MNLTHLHDAERDGADGFATVSEPVVTKRMIYLADNAGGVDYGAEVVVG